MKINTGSSTIFSTAPSTTVAIPRPENPWAIRKLFMPPAISAKKVPAVYMVIYVSAYANVAWLAPNHISRCSFENRKTTVRATDKTNSIRKPLFRILRASRTLPSPMRIAIRGEPPIPTRDPKEDSRVTIGAQTPTPASARLPTPAPMYMRSTMEYSTFTSWASIVGTARRSTRGKTASRPRSFVRFIRLQAARPGSPNHLYFSKSFSRRIRWPNSSRRLFFVLPKSPFLPRFSIAASIISFTSATLTR